MEKFRNLEEIAKGLKDELLSIKQKFGTVHNEKENPPSSESIEDLNQLRQRFGELEKKLMVYDDLEGMIVQCVSALHSESPPSNFDLETLKKELGSLRDTVGTLQNQLGELSDLDDFVSITSAGNSGRGLTDVYEDLLKIP